MNPQQVVDIAREAIIITLLLSSPMLGFGLLVGLLISILQAVTQVNEMTLTFIPKILAVLLALAFFLPWILQIIMNFTTGIIRNLPNYTM